MEFAMFQSHYCPATQQMAFTASNTMEYTTPHGRTPFRLIGFFDGILQSNVNLVMEQDWYSPIVNVLTRQIPDARVQAECFKAALQEIFLRVKNGITKENFITGITSVVLQSDSAIILSIGSTQVFKLDEKTNELSVLTHPLVNSELPRASFHVLQNNMEGSQNKIILSSYAIADIFFQRQKTYLSRGNDGEVVASVIEECAKTGLFTYAGICLLDFTRVSPTGKYAFSPTEIPTDFGVISLLSTLQLVENPEIDSPPSPEVSRLPESGNLTAMETMPLSPVGLEAHSMPSLAPTEVVPETGISAGETQTKLLEPHDIPANQSNLDSAIIENEANPEGKMASSATEFKAKVNTEVTNSMSAGAIDTAQDEPCVDKSTIPEATSSQLTPDGDTEDEDSSINPFSDLIQLPVQLETCTSLRVLKDPMDNELATTQLPVIINGIANNPISAQANSISQPTIQVAILKPVPVQNKDKRSPLEIPDVEYYVKDVILREHPELKSADEKERLRKTLWCGGCIAVNTDDVSEKDDGKSDSIENSESEGKFAEKLSGTPNNDGDKVSEANLISKTSHVKHQRKKRHPSPELNADGHSIENPEKPKVDKMVQVEVIKPPPKKRKCSASATSDKKSLLSIDIPPKNKKRAKSVQNPSPPNKAKMQGHQTSIPEAPPVPVPAEAPPLNNSENKENQQKIQNASTLEENIKGMPYKHQLLHRATTVCEAPSLQGKSPCQTVHPIKQISIKRSTPAPLPTTKKDTVQVKLAVPPQILHVLSKKDEQNKKLPVKSIPKEVMSPEKRQLMEVIWKYFPDKRKNGEKLNSEGCKKQKLTEQSLISNNVIESSKNIETCGASSPPSISDKNLINDAPELLGNCKQSQNNCEKSIAQNPLQRLNEILNRLKLLKENPPGAFHEVIKDVDCCNDSVSSFDSAISLDNPENSEMTNITKPNTHLSSQQINSTQSKTRFADKTDLELFNKELDGNNQSFANESSADENALLFEECVDTYLED